MTLLEILVALIIIGVVLYVVNTVLPMDARIKTILNAVAIVAVLLWLLSATVLPGSFWNHRIGR